MRKNKWYLLFLILALLLAFSLLAVPKIVTGVMNETRGQVITVEQETNY
jgi:hypothetical protein